MPFLSTFMFSPAQKMHGRCTMQTLHLEAENWIEVRQSKIYADARKGILLTTKGSARGNKKLWILLNFNASTALPYSGISCSVWC